MQLCVHLECTEYADVLQLKGSSTKVAQAKRRRHGWMVISDQDFGLEPGGENDFPLKEVDTGLGDLVHVAQPGSTACGSTEYLVGGYYSDDDDYGFPANGVYAVEMREMERPCVRECSALYRSRMKPQTVIAGGKLYAFGGVRYWWEHPWAEVYDMEADVWRIIVDVPMSLRRSSLSACFLLTGNKIALVGSELRDPYVIWTYDLDERRWGKGDLGIYCNGNADRAALFVFAADADILFKVNGATWIACDLCSRNAIGTVQGLEEEIKQLPLEDPSGGAAVVYLGSSQGGCIDMLEFCMTWTPNAGGVLYFAKIVIESCGGLLVGRVASVGGFRLADPRSWHPTSIATSPQPRLRENKRLRQEHPILELAEEQNFSFWYPHGMKRLLQPHPTID